MTENLQQVALPETAEFIGEEELRRRLNVSRRTIFSWRTTAKSKIPFVKIGRLVRYHWPTVQTFLLRQQRNAE
jgi:hypothetical protein